MKSLTLEEIVTEVAKTGTAESDWLFLVNIYFREGKEKDMDQWAKKNNLEWRIADYTREHNERGQLIVFRRGPDWTPPAK